MNTLNHLSKKYRAVQTETANEERRKRGWLTMQVIGWSKPPFYDPKTNNLTWGTLVRDEKGGEAINYTTRMLGRQGYMKLDMVCEPPDFEKAVAEYTDVMRKFTYKSGHKYAEFKPGDKIATIGLTALIAGGAGAVLVKSGLLAKLWKLFIPAILAIGAFFSKIWSSITGKKREE